MLESAIPAAGRLLYELTFLADYPLVVPRAQRAERWMGARRPRRTAMSVRAKLVDGQPLLLDADGGVVLTLHPLLQVAAPTPGAPDELFLLDGQGPKGARMVALPGGFQRQEESFWEQSRTLLGTGDDAPVSALDERAPYRGLSTFRPEDAAVFFGREREAEALVNRLRMQGMVAVVGPSGAGKSSFVQAGVIPSLPSTWKKVTVRPGAQPMATLRARLFKEEILVPEAEGDVHAQAQVVRARARQLVDDGALLIVVDQFEELFTLCGDAAERAHYAELLAILGRSADEPVRVVLTLRDDFLIRADELAPLRERLALGLQLVTTPVAEDLLRILIEPARRSGYAYDDPKLPAEMVRAVVGQPGALPLLSFTASKLWELRDRLGAALAQSGVRRHGRRGRRLGPARRADAGRAAPDDEQPLVREAFRRLVTAEGTRAVLSRRELLEVLGPRGEPVLEKLINARLLSASESEVESSDQIEVVHEALLAAWPRLVRWRAEDAEGARLRDQLRSAARQWDARGRPRGLLWRDEALAEYRAWRQRFGARSTATEEAFGTASLADAIRGRRIRIGLVVSAFIALSVFIAFQAVANKKSKRAKSNRYSKGY